jgi:catechol 2,3-dioxygenase-like lactoylglutathione lyase family enzyme
VLRFGGICLDCADAEELAAFYCRLLGWTETARDGPDWISIAPPDRGPVWINLQAEAWYVPPVWPEQPGAQHKMIHFELGPSDGDLAAAVAFAVECGATVSPHQPPDRDPTTLQVLLDPAGHPFCVGT